MLGLADYGSSDEEDTQAKPTTPGNNKNNVTNNAQTKKRVVNITLPLSFGAKDEEDDDTEARPLKKANTGFSLSNLLPAPKNASVPEKKGKASSTPAPEPTRITTHSTKVVGPAIKNARTANPLLNLHRASSSTTSSVETKSNEPEIDDDEPFFPTIPATAAPRPVPIPVTDTPPAIPERKKPSNPPATTQSQQSYPDPSSVAYPEQAYSDPSTYQQYYEYPQQHYDEAAYQQQQQQQQQYSDPSYPPTYYQQQQQQFHHQQQQQQRHTTAFAFEDTQVQGIANPYMGRNKREVQLDELGANVVEINQKDMLKSNRPAYSEASKLADIRKAKMGITAPKPNKVARSRHQLTAMVYEAQHKELEEQERAILYRGRY